MLCCLFLVGISPFYWHLGVLIGVVITTYFILVNVNDYNAIDDIAIEDFLESNHRHIFQYSPEVWDEFNALIEKQFTRYKVYDYRSDEITVKVENSIVKMKHDKDELILSVERSSFDFIPDRAYNYQMLKRIVSALEK